MEDLRPQRFGQYLLIQMISAGGTAEIYLAKSSGVQGFEKYLVIKRLLPVVAEDIDFRTMFSDEAQISARLTHANIGQIFEFGEIDGQYFIAMEHVAGQDLRTIRRRLEAGQQVMAVPMALFIVARVCQALDYAHWQRYPDGRSMHVVHRDVSPPNILVSYQGEVKLIDFGIAWAASRATRTRAGKLKGKFAYMSPEQVAGQAVDHRSDIFATGVVLYEMLAGRRPFGGASQLETLQQIGSHRPDPPSTINPDVPLEVDRIVMRALAKNPDERFGRASEMRAEIERYFARTQTAYEMADLIGWMQDVFASEIEAYQAVMRRASSMRLEDYSAELARAPTVAATPVTVDSRSAETKVTGTGGRVVAIVPNGEATVETPTPELVGPLSIEPEEQATPPPQDPDDLLLAASAEPEEQLTAPLHHPLFEVERAEARAAVDRRGHSAEILGDVYADGPAVNPQRTMVAAVEDYADAADDDDLLIDDGPATDVAPRPVGMEPDPFPPELGRGRLDHREVRAADVGSAVIGGAVDVASNPSIAAPAPPAKPAAARPRPAATRIGGRSTATGSVTPVPPSLRQRLRRLTSFQIILIVTLVTFLAVGAVLWLAFGADRATSRDGPAHTGTLMITTDPPADCTATIAGSKRLMSSGNPLRLSRLESGVHEVTLNCAGFRVYSQSAVVRPGEMALVEAKLERE